MSVNFEQVREIADAYEQGVRTNAEMDGRDLQTEALAAIIGAAKCLAYPADRVEAIVKAALHQAADAKAAQR